MLNRRDFLIGAGATGLTTALAGRGGATAAAPAKLVIGTRQIEVKGRAAKVFGLTGPGGKEGLQFRLGDEFDVTLENRAGVASLIHWHGLTPPWQQDGVPDVSQPALAAGSSYSYRFPLTTPGTYWMHSHQGLQEQQLAAAPLIIHDPAEATLDRQEVVVLLHDFSFRSPEEILADLTKSSGASAGMGGMAMGGSSMAGMNTAGMNMSGSNRNGSGMGGMNMSGMDMSGGGMSGMGQGGMKPDLNDVDYDAFLANGRTLEDPEVFAVDKGGRVRLRLINGAASSSFTIDTGALGATLIAVDGKGVKPVEGRRFPIAVAQRLDLLVELPAEGGAFPILALQEGTTGRTGIILASAGAAIARLASAGAAAGPVLDLQLESRLSPLQGLAERKADRRFVVKLEGDMSRYAWNFDGTPYPQHPPLPLKQGERVELSYLNTTMMSHPIHLHGHSYQVVGIGGRRFQGAVRDTVLVPPRETVDVIFDADKPGKWIMHCHQLYHMTVGMMLELHYEGFS
jgi:FtsP/CotA-like multicopper oxidase with cupredoxin domain